MSLMSFFTPYVDALMGAAYSLMQSLDGYGLVSTGGIEYDENGHIVGGYIHDYNAVNIYLGFLILLSMITALSSIATSYILWRWKGFFGAILLLSLPGILSLSSIWPAFRYTPQVYGINAAGHIGEPQSFLPLLILCLMLGWTITVNLYDTLNLGEKFRHLYDHLWYSMAIIAGVAYVWEAQNNVALQDLREENQWSRQASALLVNQLKNYRIHCVQQNISQSSSCRWANRIYVKIRDYTLYDGGLYSKLGPKSIDDLYFPFNQDIDPAEKRSIRSEIQVFNNNTCGHDATTTLQCEQTPIQYCSAYPEPFDGKVEQHIFLKPTALATECIIPTLVRSNKLQTKHYRTNENAKRGKHLRWFSFMLLTIIAGGKIANVSTKLVNIDGRSVEDRRRLLKHPWRFFRKFVATILRFSSSAWEKLCSALSSTRTKQFTRFLKMKVFRVWIKLKRQMPKNK